MVSPMLFDLDRRHCGCPRCSSRRCRAVATSKSACSANSPNSPEQSKVRLAKSDGKKVFLDEVRFEGDTKLSEAELREAAEFILHEGQALRPDQYDDLAELGRGAWQDRGYFRAEVTSTVTHTRGWQSVKRGLMWRPCVRP